MAKIIPKIGFVALKDVTKKYKGVQKFGEVRHEQPQLAQIVSFTKPPKNAPVYDVWDDRIKVGAVVIKPVTKKQEIPDGEGGKVLLCYHGDIKAFFVKEDTDV